MQQLTRQRTPESVHSWWSDSNPGLRGPTINLHTLAKPLMRRMYDRDALKYIREHRGIPLSTESIEIYLSYLLWKHVSPSTKKEIMRDLASRVRFEDEALAVVNSNVLPNVRALLPSPSEWGSADNMIFTLARHPSTTSAICSSLVNLLSDPHTDVVESAWAGLLVIVKWSEEGADAIMRAMVLDHLPRYCRHQSQCDICLLIARPSLEASFIQPLYSWEVLADIAESVGAAEAVVEAKVLDHVRRGLLSPIPWRQRRSVDKIISALEQSPSSALAACPSLVDLLSDDNIDVVVSVWEILAFIVKTERGAEAAVGGKGAGACFDRFIIADCAGARSVDDTVFTLARYPTTTLAVCLSLLSLVDLLSHDDEDVVEWAWWRLSIIAELSEAGANIIVKAKVLDHVPTGLLSPIASIRYSASRTLSNIAGHKLTLGAVIHTSSEFPATLCSLLNDADRNVVQLEAAWYTVSRIATLALGAEALVKAKVLDLVADALFSPHIDIQISACDIVERLAGHESTFPVVIRALPEFLGVFALFR
ncbi:hypothetical protein MVEN_01056200 [Mycena venus]|uniref:ARM repeat-containing protein n=1 Tax=Mycena venus TaxID=2733690 RepID=A0A8H7CZJ1_9AGAR|nr:hypothetical protein MVEN_01056200 [Mycena venus]